MRYIKNSNLIIVAFSSVFYSRIISTTLGSSLINLLHFGIVPFICFSVILSSRNKSLRQRHINFLMISGLLILLGAIVASAIWNDAGLINAIVSFMILGEPFLFLIALNSLPTSPSTLHVLKKFLYVSVLINFLLAAIQKPLIDSGLLYAKGFNGTDGCGGVFFVSGAGNYISATVSFVFALYCLVNEKKFPKVFRIFILLASLWHVLFSDSKQLVIGFGAAWVLLILLDFQDLGKTIKFLTCIILLVMIGVWGAQNIEALKAFAAWARPELYGSDGLAWYAKFYSVNLILDNFQSPLNWLFGLGPGHTVSRLGGWFLQDYSSVLDPLGATTTSIGQESRDFVMGFWLTSGSSFFSPLFGWAGIWGDLGIFGLVAYLFLGYLVWKFFCTTDVLKILLFSILIIGFIFTQMEEPGYMLFMAFIFGLASHNQSLRTHSIKPSSINIKKPKVCISKQKLIEF
ncbi:hypothetical protein IQ241_23095 [Romeria aff. gracilis LEGE 07310]|uniref:Uncharacterized protein n=1 Tax=Vasconcelosia minhoensis LEGE 07310 TaxID=915328 RepID=A0A8J7AJJ9_9CYAN|nr:hypothetical protein [Romeria gracilis]MBE9080144.1 hypothetical protein [Romeria aff. gracilis LEGE 07310]